MCSLTRFIRPFVLLICIGCKFDSWRSSLFAMPHLESFRNKRQTFPFVNSHSVVRVPFTHQLETLTITIPNGSRIAEILACTKSGRIE